MEYNEELRAWKNQTEQKKENPLEQPKKASVLEKLHRYQQEGRQQPKRTKKKPETWSDKKDGTDYEENNF